MQCSRRGAVSAITALTTIGLFVFLIVINIFAEDVDPPKPPPADVATAVLEPPKLPSPPQPETPPEATEVAQPKPELEAHPQPKIDLKLNAMPDIAATGDGVRVNTSIEIDLSNIVYATIDLDRHADPLHRAAPEYPYEMKRAGINGWARIEFIVEADGTVSHARVESASHREFGEAGLRAVRAWRFTPGMKDNKPVRSWMAQPFDFNASR